MSDAPKTPKKKSNLIYNVLLVVFAAGFLIGGYRLFDIYYHYHQADAEYSKLENTYVTAVTEEGVPTAKKEEMEALRVDYGFPALKVDFGNLLAENEDVVGWLYVDFCEVSFPVVQGPNNDYYLHRTVEGQNNRAGSIFMDYENTPDFSDMNTFIYGHNMKNGSMFGPLKALREEGGEELRKAYPYFYIFLPNNTVRKYQIFSYYVTGFLTRKRPTISTRKRSQNGALNRSNLIFRKDRRSYLCPPAPTMRVPPVSLSTGPGWRPLTFPCIRT